MLARPESLARFHLHQLVVDGKHALIRYTAEESTGSTFSNVEHFEFDGQHITNIDVYFGALTGSPAMPRLSSRA